MAQELIDSLQSHRQAHGQAAQQIVLVDEWLDAAFSGGGGGGGGGDVDYTGLAAAAREEDAHTQTHRDKQVESPFQ